MSNLLLVMSGPSGVGKGTLAKLLVDSGVVDLSISCTTRQPREGEINGRDYFFISKEAFEDMISKDAFLEYSEHFGNYYGTPKENVFKMLKDNNVLLEIDVNGGLNVKKAFTDALLIMVTPPSMEVLKDRLVGRHTETEDKIIQRLSRVEFELSKKNLYDYVIVNDGLNQAFEEIKNIINFEKQKRSDSI